jgi:thermostable 8-oxoguanine DNA glycosylase
LSFFSRGFEPDVQDGAHLDKALGLVVKLSPEKPAHLRLVAASALGDARLSKPLRFHCKTQKFTKRGWLDGDRHLSYCYLCIMPYSNASMQVVTDLRNGNTRTLLLPAADAPCLTGVPWGQAGVFFSPAFWKSRLWYATNASHDAYLDYDTGETLHDEVAACLLGGHGITSEMAQAAYAVLHSRGLLVPGAKRRRKDIESALLQPLVIPGKRTPVKYRFPALKASYLALALDRLDQEAPPSGDFEFREWLRSMKGIGWKTASWVTRNWRHSNEVAIIDIHVFRACSIAGVFQGSEETISTRYAGLEQRFLEFAHAIKEEPRRLDVLIWRMTKDAGSMAIAVYKGNYPERVA